MQFNDKFTTDLADRSSKITQAQDIGMTIPASTWTFLQQSEAQLIALMNGPTPPEPDAAGNIEFSWCLYFLNGNIPNVPPVIKEILTGLQAVLRLMKMPPSNIKTTDWVTWMGVLEHQGVLTGDGTLMATSKFAQLDVGWAITVLDYFLIQLHMKSIVPLVPPGIPTAITNKTSLKIALFGDWGTGIYQDGHLPNSPSQLVMQQMAKLAPDMAIHLGDVYYAGTYATILPKLGEEYQNLVSCWKYNAPLGNFTMNSNHEMYDGGHGLFGIALNSKYTTLFKLQNGSTIFSITFGNWIILGLDSAHAATSFYMDGAINDPIQQQLLQQVGSTTKKIMLLTHHNPLNEVGTAQNSLWNDVIKNLGRKPDYWYWGHIHNGIIYSSASAGGTVKCRCIGHAAIPIGNASWFQHKPSISFYTNTKLGDTTFPNNALRIKNGFALIEITGDTVVEKLYDQDGALAWSSN